MGTRTSPWILIAAGMLLLAGCGYQAKHPAAGVTEFHFGPSTYAGTVLIPLALAAIAVFILIKAEMILKVFAAGGLLCLLIATFTVLPSIWMDTVLVDGTGVKQTTGFRWSPTIKQYQFAQTKEVTITRKPSGPENRMSTVWQITRKDGSVFDIDPGDLWDNAADEIMRLSAEHGVPVRDAR